MFTIDLRSGPSAQRFQGRVSRKGEASLESRDQTRPKTQISSWWRARLPNPSLPGDSPHDDALITTLRSYRKKAQIDEVPRVRVEATLDGRGPMRNAHSTIIEAEPDVSREPAHAVLLARAGPCVGRPARRLRSRAPEPQPERAEPRYLKSQHCTPRRADAQSHAFND